MLFLTLQMEVAAYNANATMSAAIHWRKMSTTLCERRKLSERSISSFDVEESGRATSPSAVRNVIFAVFGRGGVTFRRLMKICGNGNSVTSSAFRGAVVETWLEKPSPESQASERCVE